MQRPPLVLTVDSDREIRLEATRGGAAVLGGLLALAALAVYLVLPGFRVAPAALGLLALWTFAGFLQFHRLSLDLERRTFTYHDGWRFASPLRRGGFDEIAGVFLERHRDAPDVEASRLRSRRIALELKDGTAGPFAFGFPMGPRVAAEKAADFARRLGVALVDRTAL